MPWQLNPTAASLLGFLHERPMTGWDLDAAAQTVIGPFWSLTRSQVYRELKALEAKGLVTAGEPGVRDRRPFSLTDEGRAAFAEWAARDPAEETIRVPMLLLVALGRHIPASRLAEHLARHHRTHAASLQGYLDARDAAKASADPDPYSMATLEFGIRYEQAVINWFAALPDLLSDIDQPFTEQSIEAP